MRKGEVDRSVEKREGYGKGGTRGGGERRGGEKRGGKRMLNLP